MPRDRPSICFHIACALILAFGLAAAAKINAALVLNFPANKSIGKLTFNENGIRRTVPAKGTITLESNCQADLRMNFDGIASMAVLGGLPPTALRGLDMSNLEIENDQFTNLANLTGLEMINARSTDLSDGGLKYLQNLKLLRSLNLSETLITSRGLAQLKPLTKLEHLSISNTNIGDDGLRELASLPRLHSLALARTHITDEGMKTLCTLPALDSIDFEYNAQITDAAIANLKVMGKRLTHLKVAHSGVTRKSIADLKNMKALVQLIYADSNFSAEDLTDLKKALPQCQFIDFNKRAHMPADLFAPLH